MLIEEQEAQHTETDGENGLAQQLSFFVQAKVPRLRQFDVVVKEAEETHSDCQAEN